jgi:hypothetical protein
MSHDLDSLERELTGLSPTPASPELRQSIARSLARPAFDTRWIAGLAAAAVWTLIALAVWPTVNSAPQQPAHASAAATNPPTLWAYHAAASRSTADLDRLLDVHARQIGSIGGPTPSLPF